MPTLERNPWVPCVFGNIYVRSYIRYADTLTWRSFTVFHDESLDKEQVAGGVENQMTQEPFQTEEVYRVLAKDASLAVFDLGNLGNMDSRLPAVVIISIIDH